MHLRLSKHNRFLIISNIYNESKVNIIAFLHNNCNLQASKYNRFLEITAQRFRSWFSIICRSLIYYLGYEEVDWYRLNGTSGIYYQLFGAKRFDLNESNSKVPLFLWLQGGPGASSLFGAYT